MEELSRLLTQAWARLPHDTARQAELIAGLGELQAHAPPGLDIAVDLSAIAREGKTPLEVSAILTEVARRYAEMPPPAGFQGAAASIEVLSAAQRFTDTELSFQLLSSAESYLEMHYETWVRGLYGLKWSVRFHLTHSPEAAVAWAELDHGSAEVCAAVIASIIELVMDGSEGPAIESLLRSRRPFLKAMGVASLFWDGWRRGQRRSPEGFERARAMLERAGIPNEDVLWMCALPAGDLQAAEFRAKDQRSDPTEATRRLQDLLQRLAGVLARARPEDRHLDDFDRALSFNARDRFHVASVAEERAPDASHRPWDALYQRCVRDVEALIGRCPGKSFHFYAPTDFDLLDVGAQSFVRLYRGKVAKRLRNRLWDHLDRLALLASDPLARNRDHDAWNEALGRASAGCLFGFLVCQHAKLVHETEHLEETVEYLIALACQTSIGAAGWFDLAGLLDRLAQESSWAVASMGNASAVETAHRAANDERVLPFLRACLACVPRPVFLRNPERAFELMEKTHSAPEKRSASRYFYLLDFVLGNGHALTIEPRRLESLIDRGLSMFPDIEPPWPAFFQNILPALQGDATKRAEILAIEATARSYCATLLSEAARHA